MLWFPQVVLTAVLINAQLMQYSGVLNWISRFAAWRCAVLLGGWGRREAGIKVGLKSSKVREGGINER